MGDRMKRRTLFLGIGIPVAAVAVVALLVLATTGSVPNPPTSLPIRAGTHYTFALFLNGYMYEAWFTVYFDVPAVETLVGAWASDGPVATSLAWANGTDVPILPIQQNQNSTLGCQMTINVTLVPGRYDMIIGSGHAMQVPGPLVVNWTVTQTIQLVPAVGNATPVIGWAGDATPCP